MEIERVQHNGTLSIWAQRGEPHSVQWSDSVHRMLISKLCNSANHQHQGPVLLLHPPCALKSCPIIIILIFVHAQQIIFDETSWKPLASIWNILPSPYPSLSSSCYFTVPRNLKSNLWCSGCSFSFWRAVDQ